MTKRTKPAAVFDNVDMFAASCKPFKPATKKLPGVSGNYAALPKRKKPRREPKQVRWDVDTHMGPTVKTRLTAKKLRRVKAEHTAAGWGRVSTFPEWHLPATRAAYDAMVEQGRKELAKNFDADQADVFREYHETVVRLTLKSIGITRPKE